MKKLLIGMLLCMAWLGQQASAAGTAAMPTARQLAGISAGPPHAEERFAARYGLFLSALMLKEARPGYVIRFSHAGGKIIKETRPDGVHGHYTYARNGELASIQYSDGRSVRGAYAPDGTLTGLIDQQHREYPLVRLPTPEDDFTALAIPALRIQETLQLLEPPERARQNDDPECHEDDERPCEVVVPSQPPEEPREPPEEPPYTDPPYEPREPEPNEPELPWMPPPVPGDGTFKGVPPIPNIPKKKPNDPSQCRSEICTPAFHIMNQYCKTGTTTMSAFSDCLDVSARFALACNESCVTGDWRWLE